MHGLFMTTEHGYLFVLLLVRSVCDPWKCCAGLRELHPLHSVSSGTSWCGMEDVVCARARRVGRASCVFPD